MNIYKTSFLTALPVVLLMSCGEDMPNNEPPPIEMGDPATIVTETDSQYLVDVVQDLNMNISRPVTIKDDKPEPQQTTTNDTTPAVASNDKPQPTPASASKQTLLAGKGLDVPFPQVRFFIPNIETRYYKKPNLETDYGASYEITEGNLRGNKIVIEGVQVENVYMRYQTIIVARADLGTLPLESLRKTTDWKKISGQDGVYTIDGLDKKNLERIKVSNKAIRRAVQRDARSRNWSRSGQNQWLRLVRNTRNTSQKPLDVALRAVMWKVTGKDANGRPFQRQLRIDVPVKR